MAWTAILGIVLLLWAAWDLYAGSVWLHREFRRDEEPGAYWSTLSLWVIVGISCFYW
ncbi:hypothetical protein [Endozoicomonas arenosclerae]|uniref:hypothetical protein n=1 Tax=Endozoicomonas arenosclerae TaxID=1633495 RepID=UPI000AC964A9|nr:hypothetical protein [Endozoicomonas arenosclerae]